MIEIGISVYYDARVGANHIHCNQFLEKGDQNQNDSKGNEVGFPEINYDEKSVDKVDD